jgi:hypothetical protein
MPLFLTPNCHHCFIYYAVAGGFRLAFRALPQCRDHMPHLSRLYGVPPPRPNLHSFLDERFFHLSLLFPRKKRLQNTQELAYAHHLDPSLLHLLHQVQVPLEIIVPADSIGCPAEQGGF